MRDAISPTALIQTPQKSFDRAVTHCTPCTVHCVLPTAYCSLPTDHCLLTTAYCPLPHIPNVPGPFVKTGFFITLGFFATNEAAAEIENPFDGGANDLPLEYYLREFVEGLNDLNQAGGTDTPFSVGNKSFNLSEVGSYCQHTPPRHMSYVICRWGER